MLRWVTGHPCSLHMIHVRHGNVVLSAHRTNFLGPRVCSCWANTEAKVNAISLRAYLTPLNIPISWVYLPPPPRKGPGTRDTYPLGRDLVPEIPTPLEGTWLPTPRRDPWFQRYLSPRRDLLPEIPPWRLTETCENITFPQLLLSWCTVIKVPHAKREGGPVLLLQNYPHPLSLRGRGPYHFPTPLNTWAPSTRLPSPLLLFPLK